MPDGARLGLPTASAEGDEVHGVTRRPLRGAAAGRQGLAGSSRHLLQLAGQPEPHVLFDHVHLANLGGARSPDFLDHLGHQEFRRRGAGRDAHAPGALEPFRADVVLVVDQVGRRAHHAGDLHQPVRVRAVRRADDEQHVDLAGDGLHRRLPVLRRVADIILGRAHDPREAPAQRLDAVARVVDGEGRLREVGHLLRVRHVQPIDVLGMRDQEHPIGRLAHGAHDLVVVGVADEDDRVPLARVADRLEVHLGDERTGGVDHAQSPALGLVAHGGGDAVGAEDDRRPVRHLVELVDEVGALGAKRLHHVPVVHDLLAHVDGIRTHLQRQLDDVDGAIHTRAEAAGSGEHDLLHARGEGRLGSHAAEYSKGTPLPQRVRGSGAPWVADREARRVERASVGAGQLVSSGRGGHRLSRSMRRNSIGVAGRWRPRCR